MPLGKKTQIAYQLSYFLWFLKAQWLFGIEEVQGGLLWFGLEDNIRPEAWRSSPLVPVTADISGYCVELPHFLHRLFWDSLYRVFVCVSGCVWVWVCLCIFKWVCAKCWDRCTFFWTSFSRLCNMCPSISICKSIPLSLDFSSMFRWDSIQSWLTF